MIMASFTGAPIGGFVGGLAVSALLAHFGWEVIFVIGGVVPLIMVPVMMLWLPESPRFLARKPNLSARQKALLAYLDIAPAAELTDRDRIRRHPAFRIQRVPTPSPSPVLLQVIPCSIADHDLQGQIHPGHGIPRGCWPFGLRHRGAGGAHTRCHRGDPA